jgi:hypothetical protein
MQVVRPSTKRLQYYWTDYERMNATGTGRHLASNLPQPIGGANEPEAAPQPSRSLRFGRPLCRPSLRTTLLRGLLRELRRG